jgi:putative endonuclease
MTARRPPAQKKAQIIASPPTGSALAARRKQRGALNYLSGHCAEHAVARHYCDQGQAILAMNWRGKGGEIDIIVRDQDRIIFIEVKKASSHALAAERLGARQIERIYAAAAEFLGGEPDGELTPAQFDVALVDQLGRIEILENAITA